MSRLIIRFCALRCCADDDEKKFISIRARCCSMRAGIQKRYIKEEKIYPNHPRALCVHACSVHLEVCVYIVYAFRGPSTMDQHARARCIFDDLSMITILGRRYLQQHREPYVDYCSSCINSARKGANAGLCARRGCCVRFGVCVRI
jgi:hypothetical protein